MGSNLHACMYIEYIYIYIYIYTCIYRLRLWRRLLFVAYWFPSYMLFGTVPKGFEKHGGWGEACTLPIDTRTYISIAFETSF